MQEKSIYFNNNTHSHSLIHPHIHSFILQFILLINNGSRIYHRNQGYAIQNETFIIIDIIIALSTIDIFMAQNLTRIKR